MKKKEYKAAAAKLGLKIRDWLDILPCHDKNGEAIRITPVPIVMFPFKDIDKITQRVNKAGFHFAWSTVNYYYLPEGYETKAMIRNRV